MDDNWEENEEITYDSCKYYNHSNSIQYDYPIYFKDLKNNKKINNNNNLNINYFNEYWDNIENQISSVYGGINKNSYNNIYNYFINPLDSEINNILPIALVHMGMNAVDNDNIITQFISFIKQKEESYFIVLDKDVYNIYVIRQQIVLIKF